MNRFLSFGTLAALALLFLAGASQTPAVPTAAPPSMQPMEISIEIAPTYHGPYELLRQRFTETFTCTARLTDPDTHKLVVAVSVSVTPGNEATNSVTQGDLTITLMGKIGSERTGATTDLTVTRNGQLVTHQKSTLFLTRRVGQPYY